MNIIDRDNSNFEIIIETLDDLWVLSQILVSGDRVFSKTERKVKIGSGANYKVTRKLIFVDLIVSRVKFENEVLKVMGEIQNETEFTSVGSAQTLNFSVGDKIKFEKKNLLKYEENLLDASVNSKKSHNLMVLFDKDVLFAVEFSEFSYKVLFKKSGLGSKKYHETSVNEEEEKFLILKEFLGRDYSKIIFAGPGVFKDKLQKYVKDKVGLSAIVFSWNDVSSNGILKAISKINSSGMLGESQLSYEMGYINQFLENISKSKKVAYGEKDVFNSVNSGSCEVFLVSTKFIDEKKDAGTYGELNAMMVQVEQLSGKLVIVNSKHESGKVLDGVGGIGALLRY